MNVHADFASLFVTPRDAYRWTQSRAQKWQDVDPTAISGSKFWSMPHRPGQLAPGDLVLSLVGERGIGKTWFLRYLADHDQRLSPLTVYLDLARRVSFSTPGDYVKEVESQIHSQVGAGRVILLLDSVPPQLDEPLRALEDSVLRPHLIHRSSLVIMALMHPSQVCWRAPVLRGGEFYRLRPFDEAQTQEQVRYLQKAKLAAGDLDVQHVQQLSGGLPLLNFLLATSGWPDAYGLLLDYWFLTIPPGDRECIQGYLEAVCLLDCLEHASMQRSLQAYHCHKPDAVGYPAHAGGVRNMLRKYWLARPAPDAPGRIVLVDSVRHAVAQILQAEDAELYAALQKSAEEVSERRK